MNAQDMPIGKAPGHLTGADESPVNLAAERPATAAREDWSWRRLLVPFVVLFFLYLFGISAILRANFYYIDDLGRTFEGYADWGIEYSRYVSDLLAPLLFADTHLTDISPLPQVIAIAEMALAGTLVFYLVSDRDRPGFWDYAALVPFGLSPYFLECLSYKFDAPFMALSVLASILPLLISRRRPEAYVAAVAGGTLVMCMTYQVSSCVLPLVTIMVAYQRWHRGEGYQWAFLGKTILGYVIAILFFFLFLMKPLSSEAYVSADLPDATGIFARVIGNYAQFACQFLGEFKIFWLVLVCAVGVLFVIVTTLTARAPGTNRALAPVYSILVLLGLALLAFGLYPVLAKPLIEPRTMYGIGIGLTLVMLPICGVPRMWAPKVVCLVLSWCLFVFAFTYGNALHLQSEWIEFRTEQTIDGLDDLELDAKEGDEPMDVLIIGDAGLSPAFDSMDADDRVLLERLIPQSHGGAWWWNMYGIKCYYRLEELGNLNFITTETNESEGLYNRLPLVKKTPYNRYYSDGQHMKIEVLGESE